MLYIIRGDVPYLVSGGREYPVEITETEIIMDRKNARPAETEGYLTLQEVIAKVGHYRKKKRGRKEEV